MIPHLKKELEKKNIDFYVFPPIKETRRYFYYHVDFFINQSEKKLFTHFYYRIKIKKELANNKRNANRYLFKFLWHNLRDSFFYCLINEDQMKFLDEKYKLHPKEEKKMKDGVHFIKDWKKSFRNF